jgi:hypothetical protein
MIIKQSLDSLEQSALTMESKAPTVKKSILADSEKYLIDLRNASFKYKNGSYIRIKLIELERAFGELAKVRLMNLNTDHDFVAEILTALTKLRSSLCFGQAREKS